MVVFYIILAVAVAAIAVFLTKARSMHVTGFVAVALVAVLLPTPVYAITTAVAKNDQQTFHEYWNGYETAAYTQVQTCVIDGSCQHTYSCDPYTVTEIETYYDSDGKAKTRFVTKTKWRECPYSSEETTFYVDTTLDTFVFGDSLMTGKPYRSKGIPGGQVTTPPADWAAVKARVEAGTPGGVTKVSKYKNFILGSEQTLFKRYSDKIDLLEKDNLLPSPAAGVQNHYDASKAYFVGDMKGVDKDALTKNVQSLNGAMGTDLHGDLHVVFVQASAIEMSAEDYGNALMAHWQSKEFGRDAIAKNSVILVVGVEGYKKTVSTEAADTAGVTAEPVISTGTPVVAWAKGFTGMPLGNESLLTQFGSQLPGTVIDENFIGSPTFDVKHSKIVHTDGVVESMLYGENKFTRVSMTAADAEDSGSGFAYLGDDWKPDTATMVWFYIIASILFAGAMFGAMMLSTNLVANRTNDFLAHLFSKSKN